MSASQRPLLIQDPLPILRFTIQFPWQMKSGNSAKFAEKHEVREKCSKQIEEALWGVYDPSRSDKQPGRPDPTNQAIAALAGLIAAIEPYLNGSPDLVTSLQEAALDLQTARNPKGESQAPLTAEAMKTQLTNAMEALDEAAKKAIEKAIEKATEEATKALEEATKALGSAADALQRAKALGSAADALQRAKAIGSAADALQRAKAALEEATKALEEATKALGSAADAVEQAKEFEEAKKALGFAADAVEQAKKFEEAKAAMGSAAKAAMGSAADAVEQAKEFEEAKSWLVATARLAAGGKREDNGSGSLPKGSLGKEVLLKIKRNGKTLEVKVQWPVLVKKNAFCLVDLDVEIATKNPAWALVSGLIKSSQQAQQGPDLDNLLKTICDGLRFPGDQNANPDAETCISIAEGKPFFCLVEDDALIRQINSRLTVLLEDVPANGGADSRVTVNVVVLSYRFPNFSGNAAPSWSPDIKGMLTPLA